MVKKNVLPIWLELPLSWVFQGILAMDPSETLFKFALELFFALALCSLFWAGGMSLLVAALVGVAVIHTMSWLIYDAVLSIRSFGLTTGDRATVETFLDEMAARSNSLSFLHTIGVFGSYPQGRFGPRSDLDFLVIRKPGVWNAVQACLWALGVRIHCLVRALPIDILVLDSDRNLSRRAHSESAVSLKDEAGVIRSRFRLVERERHLM